jgi:hypothetical protein
MANSLSPSFKTVPLTSPIIATGTSILFNISSTASAFTVIIYLPCDSL